MADAASLLAANRAAVDELAGVAEVTGAHWTTPRSPGKWSPQQVVEHVAMVYEEAGNEIGDRPTKLPTLPVFVRPLARIMFKRVVKTGRFPKAKTNKAMDPASGPTSPGAARARLDAALAQFEEACLARAATGEDVTSGAFGRVALADYLKFTALHTRHHTRQIPVSL